MCNSYLLFKTIYDCGRCPLYVDVMNKLIEVGFFAVDADNLLKALLNEGYITGRLVSGGSIKLTSKGILRLCDLSQQLHETIEERAYISSENRKQRKMELIAGCCGAVLGVILGYILNAVF